MKIKSTKISYSLLILFLFFSTSSFSQKNDVDKELTYEQIQLFKERVGLYIDDFQKYITIIGSKENDIREKKYYIEEACDLFINNGDKVVMETSSTRTNVIKRQPLINYLNHLGSIKYDKVEITFAETFYVSEFHKTSDGYTAVASIFQHFCGYVKLEGKYVKQYCDQTKKNITIHLKVINDLYGEIWVVKLGNISVAETP